MTSEVVVMNRLGIALASDSASTVYVGGRVKFYHADKLFMLSTHHPVGAMVYNNSSLLGVPWETILKMFRADLGTTRFDELEDYAKKLINYLNQNLQLFPSSAQRNCYLQLVKTLYEGLQKTVNDVLLMKARDDQKDGPKILRQVEKDIVSKALEEWQNKKDINQECFDGDTTIGKRLAGQESGEIHRLIATNFPSADTDLVNQLTELARLVVDKEEILAESLSGLVIAGYGERDVFPVMLEYELGEIFLGKLKYKQIGLHRIDNETPSIVKPFAQSETVETFLEGVSPSLNWKITQEITKILVESPAVIIDAMPGVSKNKKDAYKKKVQAVSKEVALKLVRDIKNYRQLQHLRPILQSIEFLPKNELAHVASSLVNLSSFQKRMSISEDETVGGPIDVAVISKGDGFVWIDRKNYFKPELNRHFFKNKMSQDIPPNGDNHGE